MISLRAYGVFINIRPSVQLNTRVILSYYILGYMGLKVEKENISLTLRNVLLRAGKSQRDIST